MTDDFPYLKSRRFWVLIILGPPLNVIIASLLLAASHVGLGSPLPTPAELGEAVYILVLLGYFLVFVLLNFTAIQSIYRVKLPPHAFLPHRGGYFPGILIGLLTAMVGIALIDAAPLDFLNTGLTYALNNYLLMLVILKLGALFLPAFVVAAEGQRRDDRCGVDTPGA